MKATLFSRVPYMGPAPGGVWPVPPAAFAPEAAEQSMDAAFEQFQLADALGFDWITLAEHHYAPLSLTPNPMVMAGAVSQRVRRAKIALLCRWSSRRQWGEWRDSGISSSTATAA